MSEEINQLPKRISVVIGDKLYRLKPYTLRLKMQIVAKWKTERAWFESVSSQDSNTVLDTLLMMFDGETPFKDKEDLAEALPGNAIALDQITTAIWENYLASSPEMADAMHEAAKKKREAILAEMQAKLTE